MTLSICIPVYNQSIEQLVNQLQEQMQDLNDIVELRLIDDGSNDEIASQNEFFLTGLPNTFYQKNTENVGRAAIRNQLAEWSTAKFVLYLDCDVLVPTNFIKNYLDYLEDKETLLACGGCIYPKRLKEPGRELRYLYGRQVEQLSVHDHVVSSPFLGANFLVSRNVFSKIRFDDQIQGYGFEDELFRQDYEITFSQEAQMINNPVEINYIDTNPEYLLKTKSAMKTLAMLVNNGRIMAETNLRILIAYDQLKAKGLVNSFCMMIKAIEPTVLFFLDTSKPNLKIFQLYKLFLFATALNEQSS